MPLLAKLPAHGREAERFRVPSKWAISPVQGHIASLAADRAAAPPTASPSPAPRII